MEDEAAVRRFACFVLEQRGYTVLEARSGAEALQAAAAASRGVDLLLTDVVMPQMSGPELGRRLHTLLPKLRVLYMSGYSGGLVTNHGILEPHVDLIQKPFDAPGLLRRVRDALSP